MLQSSFSIKLIVNPFDKDYIKSLNLYNATTPVNIKTSSNEITYWITHSNTKFKIYPFSLFIGEDNIGFAMVSYLLNSRNLVIDYIAIDDKYKNNAVFLAFFNLVQMFFYDQKIDINYTIVEINNKSDGLDIDKESSLFLKFLCIEEFTKIDHEYISLPLGNENAESSFPAFLYIKSADRQNTISKETFVSLVQDLYIDYYMEWYSPFFKNDQIMAYNDLIKKHLSELTQSLTNLNRINLKTTCCTNITPNCSGDSNKLPVSKSRGKKWHWLFFVIIIVLPIPLIWAYNFALEKIGIPINSVNALLGGLLSALITGLISFLLSKKRL